MDSLDSSDPVQGRSRFLAAPSSAEIQSNLKSRWLVGAFSSHIRRMFGFDRVRIIHPVCDEVKYINPTYARRRHKVSELTVITAE